MKKKRLVVASSSDQKKSIGDNLPDKYLLSKRWWICEIIAENQEGIVEEIEFKPKSKMRLDDVLGLLRDYILEELPEDVVDCGYRVFDWK